MKRQIAFVFAAVSAFACVPPPNEQLMTECSGTFVCVKNNDYSDRMGIALSAQGDACGNNWYRFHLDGTVTTPTPHSGTWTASAWSDNDKRFDFTVDQDSYSCHSAKLVTCLRTFQVTTDCNYEPKPAETTCVENLPPDACESKSWGNYGACSTFNDDTEIAFTNGETCADLGY